MKIVNLTRRCALVEQGQIARTFWERLRGLLGRVLLAPGDGLWLPGTKSVHTVGMRFAIDVVFVDRHNRIICMIPAMSPGRISPYVPRAIGALELPPETLRATHTQLRDEMEIDV